MTQNIEVIAVTAASVAFIHTLFGPDHYLPFIVMSKARRWSALKTTVITILCGLGHVGSSIVLGLIGIALGIGVHKLTAFESVRGNIAAWAFVIFGFTYFVWGMWRAIKNRPHSHIHEHADGHVHSHDHGHYHSHTHVHDEKNYTNITPWILFTIFVLGPCEPLIPIVMYPAAEGSVHGVVVVSLLFSVITIATMLAIVWLGIYGIGFVKMGKLERYTHALAGATICLSGCAIVFLGL